MRFLVDECTGPTVANWLRSQGHEVDSVFDETRGADDVSLLECAFRENRILITNDKDFGEHVFRDRRPHKGVVLLRLEDERPENKIAALRRLLAGYADQLTERFCVVTESVIRIVASPIGNGPTPPANT